MPKLLTLWKLSKFVGPVLVVAGLVLLYFGYQTSQSASSRIGELFSGRPADEAIYFYVGGAVLVVVGLGSGAMGFLKKKT